MVHLGQRKLLLTEIQFLTLYGHIATNIIYVGAAPGHHISYLSILFPNNIFHLFDPRDFAVSENSNIKIYNRYFDENVLHFDKFLLISDIRQNIHTNISTYDLDKIIVDDMNLQKKWIENLKPIASLLKFRLPMEVEYYEYFDGDIVNQPWCRESTFESRLIVTSHLKYKQYNTYDYNDSMLQFKQMRKTYVHDHKIPLKRVPGLDHCYDCCLEIEIWKQYLNKYGEISKTNISNCMKRTNTHLKKYLTSKNHGKMRIS